LATEITTEEVIELATAPASIAVDGQSVSERPLRELLDAQATINARTATASGGSAWGKVRMAKAVPPGGSGS